MFLDPDAVSQRRANYHMSGYWVNDRLPLIERIEHPQNGTD